MRRIITFFFLIFVALPNSINALSEAEKFKLNEQCGKGAEVFFKRGEEDLEKRKSQAKDNQEKDELNRKYITNYTNHYNKKLNKCFILISSETFPDEKYNNMILMATLTDIHENKLYGRIVIQEFKMKNPDMCNVLEKVCRSKNEWDTLVKPFMEE